MHIKSHHGFAGRLIHMNIWNNILYYILIIFLWGNAKTVALIKSMFAPFQVIPVINNKQHQDKSIECQLGWSFEPGNQSNQLSLCHKNLMICTLQNMEL